jgi:hypothetical protein
MATGNPENQELDLESSMQSILEDIKSRDEVEEVQEEQSQELEVNESEAQESVKEVEEKAQESVDESTDESAEEVVGEVDEEVTQETAEEVVQEESEKQKSAIRAPSSWSAKAKAAFYDLPDHIQSEVEKREADFHNGIAKYKEAADYGTKLQKVIAPYEAQLRANGQQADQVVGTMLNAAYKLSQGTPQQKAQFIKQIAMESGADLQSLVSSGDNTTNEPKSEYVQQLEQRLAQIEGFTQNQATLAKQKEKERVDKLIYNFRNTLNEDKTPKYPFFDDVEGDMAVLINMAKQQGRQLSLEDAYERAVRANPATYEVIRATEQKRVDEKRRQEQAKKTAKAKKIASVNVKTTPSTQRASTQEPLGSLDDTLRKTMERIQSR